MALVEFGDQAYVITPFTTDYDNIRLSLSLIGDFGEFIRFPDQGTLLGNAVAAGRERCSRRSTSCRRPGT